MTRKTKIVNMRCIIGRSSFSNIIKPAVVVVVVVVQVGTVAVVVAIVVLGVVIREKYY